MLANKGCDAPLTSLVSFLKALQISDKINLYFCRKQTKQDENMKRVLVLFASIFMTIVAVNAAERDSLNTMTGTISRDTFAVMTDNSTMDVRAAAEGERTYDPHHFNLKRLILPTALLGVGVWGVGNDWMDHLNRQVKDEVQENIDRKFGFDDYMQFAPMVAAYGLDWCGVKAAHGFKDRTVILAMSAVIMAAVTNGMKYTFREMRPDGSARNSFPSGHTATAFMGAELLRMEYKDVSPWIGYAGYAVAAGVGFFRVYNNRHWLNDIIAGAGVGILSTRVAYWLYPKIFHDKTCTQRKSRPMIVASPFCGDGGAGLSAAIVF